MEKFDDLIIGTKLKRDDCKTRLKALHKKYAHRDDLIEEMMVEKRLRELLNAQKDGALRLQSWWRAIIFRKEIKFVKKATKIRSIRKSKIVKK